MNPFLKFLVSSAGRLARIVAGLALIAGGLLWLSGITGVIVALVGVVPLVAGALDLCVFAPLFGYSVSGPKTRAAVR
jgi:hypothetical protein